MIYNSDRTKLKIPEYGRHVQQMVDYCLTIEDRAKRTKTARSIIDVMGNLNPHLRDVDDFKSKLWDQLHIMSDFKMEIDMPYKIPTKEELFQKPQSLSYPHINQKYRFYGKNLLKMIQLLKEVPKELQEKNAVLLANYMKKSYLIWNKDTVDDSTIFSHLYEILDGHIDLRNKNITLQNFNYKSNNSQNFYPKKKKKPKNKIRKPVL